MVFVRFCSSVYSIKSHTLLFAVDSISPIIEISKTRIYFVFLYWEACSILQRDVNCESGLVSFMSHISVSLSHSPVLFMFLGDFGYWSSGPKYLYIIAVWPGVIMFIWRIKFDKNVDRSNLMNIWGKPDWILITLRHSSDFVALFSSLNDTNSCLLLTLIPFPESLKIVKHVFILSFWIEKHVPP